MITIKNRFKLFVSFSVFAIFSSSIYACGPIAIVVRSAENITATGGLTPVGKLHADAYKTLPQNLVDTNMFPNACGITSIRVTATDGVDGSINAYDTALPLARSLRLENEIKKDSNWSSDSIKSLDSSVGSALLVFNHKILWGDSDSGELNKSRLLVKLLNPKSPDYTANLEKISEEGSPYSNFVYVYSGRQNDDGTYNKVNIYFQAYKLDSATAAQCHYIIPGTTRAINGIIWHKDRTYCMM